MTTGETDGQIAADSAAATTARTMLDAGGIPVEGLAALAAREGWRPRPIYGAHRWFARRFGSAFRGLLTAAALPPDGDFWHAYYAGADWRGRTVLDPFVGGGTSVVEAQRLGATTVGVDIDAVACAITAFEARAASIPDLLPALAQLKDQAGAILAPFYQTQTPEGTTETVLHYFWVQQIACPGCHALVEAHPHYQLAYEAEGTRQWVFCRSCHAIRRLDRDTERFRCLDCGGQTERDGGPVRFGRFTCPHCGARERLIDTAARTGRPPVWRLFAVETIEGGSGPGGSGKGGSETRPYGGRGVPLEGRWFRTATAYDHAVFARASRALAERTRADGAVMWVPDRSIPREGRADDRLPRYGYRRYREMFNDRQLLHLSHLAEAVAGLAEPVRAAAALAFSDHLATTCMLTHYARGWRRLSPLFSLRAYRHVTRPVEINPWLDGTGRGTFPNGFRQVQRAIAAARAPREPLPEGGFRPVATRAMPAARIVQGDARRLGFLADRSVDLVLTDPPYLDNIAYAELSDFFLPWLQLLGQIPVDGRADRGLTANLAAKDRGAAAVEAFGESLRACFAEIGRVLKPVGRLVFTYQHQTAGAWLALAGALAGAGLRPVQVFPLLGDGRAGLHRHGGSSRWDAVFVMAVDDRTRRPPEAGGFGLSAADERRAGAHWHSWVERLAASAHGFAVADGRNFYRACLVAGALGMFGAPRDGEGWVDLNDALEQGPPAAGAADAG